MWYKVSSESNWIWSSNWKFWSVSAIQIEWAGLALGELNIVIFLNFLYFLRVFVFFMRSAASTCLSCRCSFIRFFSDRLECAELSLESLEFELEEDVERALLRFSDFFFDLKISLLLSRYINSCEICFFLTIFFFFVRRTDNRDNVIKP